MARSANAGKKKVRFEYLGNSGDEVFVAGNFNGWDPTASPLKEDGDGVFSRTMFVEKGECEYKFVVNGTWCVDPACSDWVPNEMGSLNSVIKVN